MGSWYHGARVASETLARVLVFFERGRSPESLTSHAEGAKGEKFYSPRRLHDTSLSIEGHTQRYGYATHPAVVLSRHPGPAGPPKNKSHSPVPSPNYNNTSPPPQPHNMPNNKRYKPRDGREAVPTPTARRGVFASFDVMLLLSAGEDGDEDGGRVVVVPRVWRVEGGQCMMPRERWLGVGVVGTRRGARSREYGPFGQA